jgi:hypothetical protein
MDKDGYHGYDTIKYRDAFPKEYDSKSIKGEQGEPVACERCKQLEEQAYDLLGQLKVANIKLAYTTPQPAQKPWVGLTHEDKAALSEDAEGNTWMAVELTEAKLKEKNT